MKKVFIDGSSGTTGLRIRERLAVRDDIEIISLSDDKRKDVAARRDALNAADVAFLCLPDASAVESVQLVDNRNTVIIDTSTAHRVNPEWAYGFPEIGGGRKKIISSKRIANPGCHASGFVALVAPLVERGLILPDAKLCAFSLTGYSGGGKKMIADYEDLKYGGRQYALGQMHKHLPEIAMVCGLRSSPVFSPIVVPHYSGMEVTVQLHEADLEEIKACYSSYYDRGVVRFSEDISDGGFISSDAMSGRDDMFVGAYGSEGRVILVSLFDNLGKGASGSAIQNMNLVLGCEETKGLVIGDRQ